jgi:hypothetical protein
VCPCQHSEDECEKVRVHFWLVGIVQGPEAFIVNQKALLVEYGIDRVNRLEEYIDKTLQLPQSEIEILHEEISDGYMSACFFLGSTPITSAKPPDNFQ